MMETKNEKLLVTLVMDEIFIKEGVQYNKGNGFLGPVDKGTHENGYIGKPILANKALVLIAVGVNCHFKLPIGYFLLSQ